MDLLQAAVSDAELQLAALPPEERLAAVDESTAFWLSPDRELLASGDASAVRRAALALVVTWTKDPYHRLAGDIGAMGLESSALARLAPELLQRISDEGLLDLATPDVTLTMDGIEFRQLFICAHQFLRRCFGASPNYDFLRTLSDYRAQRPMNTALVAVDPRRIMERTYAPSVAEFDYWRGPPFSWSDLDDPHSIGLTVHADSEMNQLIRLCGLAIQRTEFFWSFRDGTKTLQIEELPPADVQQVGGHIVTRYLHARRDIRTQRFVHLDGAAKVYEPSTYERRFAANMPNACKSDAYIKLFRTDVPEGSDGSIPDRWFSKLTCFFFRQNKLVPEYFGRDLSVADP